MINTYKTAKSNQCNYIEGLYFINKNTSNFKNSFNQALQNQTFLTRVSVIKPKALTKNVKRNRNSWVHFNNTWICSPLGIGKEISTVGRHENFYCKPSTTSPLYKECKQWPQQPVSVFFKVTGKLFHWISRKHLVTKILMTLKSFKIMSTNSYMKLPNRYNQFLGWEAQRKASFRNIFEDTFI